MKKILFSVSLIILATFNNVSAQTTIKIGASVDLVNQQADSGKDIQNALTFANKELTGSKYSLTIENDWCDSRDSAAVAQKLAGIDKVNYVFGGCNNVVNFTASVYAASNILMFAPVASSVDPSEDLANVFRAAPSDENAALLLNTEIQSKHKKYGILTEESVFTKGVLSVLTKNSKAGISSYSESYDSSPESLKAAISKLKANDIEAIFINTESEKSFVEAFKEIKSSGAKWQIYSIRVPSADRNMFEGVVFSDLPGFDDILTAEGKKLIEKYVSVYGKPKSNEFTVLSTIELLRALDLAIKSGSNVKDYLLTSSFDGIFGKYNFDKSGNITGINHIIKQIKNGAAVPLNNLQKFR